MMGASLTSAALKPFEGMIILCRWAVCCAKDLTIS